MKLAWSGPATPQSRNPVAQRLQTLASGGTHASDWDLCDVKLPAKLPRSNVGAASRHFAVTGGTGRYAGASGSGSITVEVLDAGAIETWSGAVYLRHNDKR